MSICCVNIFSVFTNWICEIVLKNVAVLTGKHQCWSLFIDKVAGFVTLSKKDSDTGEFPVSIPQFLIAAFYIEHLRWLLL